MINPSNPCFDDCATVTGAPCPCVPVTDQVCYLKAACFFNNYPDPNPLMSGKWPADYISPKSAGRFHRTLSMINNAYVMNNKNMHKYVVEEYSYALRYIVDSDETWDFTIKMYQDIVVKTGTTLTITCKVLMPREGKIIVEPGARLIVDGGFITCAHDSFWQGIEVHGNYNLSQFTNQQGDLLIKNGAIIEHARCAVALWERNDFLTTGGFVKCYNSTFRNNETDIEALFYSNDYNGSHYANKTFFQNTEFIWDDNFRETAPHGHVILALVDGITFSGCTFADSRDIGTTSFVEGNTGIFSLDAGYRVVGRCSNLTGCMGDIEDPLSGWDPTVFENLYFGIYATNSLTTNTINIDKCVFRDNGYGVQMVSAPVIVRNKFVFTTNTNHFAVGASMYGIHAVNSTNLKIEENTFIDIIPGISNTYGVVSSDLGEQYERIYKNTFSGMFYGNFAQGENRSFLTNGLVGLEFPCNTNINNHWDHRVVPTLWGIDGLNYGVKKTSGSFLTPVGTSFSSDPGNLVFDEDYRNSSHFPITYWYHSTQTPDDWQATWVNMFNNPTATNNTCGSTLINYSGGVGKLPPGVKAAFQNEFYLIGDEITLKEAQYEDDLLDVGEIFFIMAEIDDLAPNNKQAVRNMLISYSPYLTTEILFAVADNAPSDYNHLWLRDLLLANIEAVTPELLQFLQTKQFPLPAPMRQAIANAVSVTYTEKTILESEISQLYAERAFYSNSLVIDVLHDTIFVDNDSLRHWLTLQNNILFQQQIIDSYLQEGNFALAENEIDNLELFSLNAPTHLRIEIADFVSLKRWLIIILQTQGHIAQLPQGDLSYLRNMANRGSGTARYQARNILCFFYNECEAYLIDAESDPRSQITTTNQSVEKFEPSFSIYPNPASNWVMIELSQGSYDHLENPEIIITDLTGKVIHQTQLTRSTYLWETGTIENGVYLILVRSHDKLFTAQKVIVNR